MTWLHTFVDVPADVANPGEHRFTARDGVSDAAEQARARYSMRSLAGPAFDITSDIPAREAA